MKAKRILVIGCPGAGKSTLSLELAELSGLPLIHLDKEYWKKHERPHTESFPSKRPASIPLSSSLMSAPVCCFRAGCLSVSFRIACFSFCTVS